MYRRNAKDCIGNIIVYLILILAVVVILLPLGWVVSTSFKPSVEIFANPPFWIPHASTVKSYVNVWLMSSIPGALLNSFLTGLFTALLALFFGGSAGYAFARFKFRGNKFLSLFMLISQMLPITVLMIPLYYMENDFGIIDTRLGLAVAHLVFAMPLVTWMARGYFKGIPKEIEEAATVDGCSTLQTIFRIILPLVRPALATTAIYAFVSSWNEFLLANVLTRTMNSRTAPLALNEFSTFYKVAWGDTMAAAVLITIPVVAVFSMIQKQFVSGLSSGAVKG